MTQKDPVAEAAILLTQETLMDLVAAFYGSNKQHYSLTFKDPSGAFVTMTNMDASFHIEVMAQTIKTIIEALTPRTTETLQ